VFREVYVNFLLVGHTHEDIDAMFGRWSCRLRENDYPTLPMLMKSFMDAEMEPVILHLIEEVPNFKAFVDGYLCSGNDVLQAGLSYQAPGGLLAGGRAALSITLYMNGVGYCRQRNYCSKFSLLQ
jgi:hypothetical protein